MGKLHRERAVIGRIFQALPTQIDTITVAFSGVTENDLLWAGVCPDRPTLPCPALFAQTDTMFAFIYRMMVPLQRWGCGDSITSYFSTIGLLLLLVFFKSINNFWGGFLSISQRRTNIQRGRTII